MKPSREFPHPKSSLAYSGGPANGISPPQNDIRIDPAPVAEAAKSGKESTRYALLEMDIIATPKVWIAVAMMGAIQ